MIATLCSFLFKMIKQGSRSSLCTLNRQYTVMELIRDAIINQLIPSTGTGNNGTVGVIIDELNGFGTVS